jgi:hypothetical protein
MIQYENERIIGCDITSLNPTSLYLTKNRREEQHDSGASTSADEKI